MLIDLLMNLFSTGLVGLMSLLPTVDFVIPSGLFDWLQNILNAVGYFLPLGDILAIFGISFAIYNFSFIWKLVTKLWQLLKL